MITKCVRMQWIKCFYNKKAVRRLQISFPFVDYLVHACPILNRVNHDNGDFPADVWLPGKAEMPEVYRIFKQFKIFVIISI